MFWQFEITSKILIGNRENIPVQYVSHALETTNSSRNKTILGSGDHQVIGSPSSNQGKIPANCKRSVDKSPPVQQCHVT
jgi:hypothetical protein